MRILQVIPVFSAPFGGPVTVVRSISKELAKKHDVTVYTTSASDRRCDFEDPFFEAKSEGYNVIYFPRIFKFSGFNVSPIMTRALKETLSEYDIVHLHSWRHFQDIIVHHYAKKYDIPYVLQAHGSLPRIVAKQGLKWVYDMFFGYRLLKDASKLIALTQTEAQQYKGMGVPEEKIAIVPNGIDLSKYGDLPPKGSFKKKFGIDDNEKIVLYLGRIHKIKGIDILAKAFADIVEKLDDVKLVVVGPDDGYLGELEALAAALEIENNMLILGALYGGDKLNAYVDADVYILPSRYETFPMSVLEAVACGTPIILTENCGIAEYFRDRAGLVVRPEQNRISEALLEMLLDQETQNRFRKKCRTAIERFDISKTVSKLEEVYKEFAK